MDKKLTLEDIAIAAAMEAERGHRYEKTLVSPQEYYEKAGLSAEMTYEEFLLGVSSLTRGWGDQGGDDA